MIFVFFGFFFFIFTIQIWLDPSRDWDQFENTYCETKALNYLWTLGDRNSHENVVRFVKMVPFFFTTCGIICIGRLGRYIVNCSYRRKAVYAKPFTLAHYNNIYNIMWFNDISEVYLNKYRACVHNISIRWSC